MKQANVATDRKRYGVGDVSQTPYQNEYALCQSIGRASRRSHDLCASVVLLVELIQISKLFGTRSMFVILLLFVRLSQALTIVTCYYAYTLLNSFCVYYSI